jgi:hypothetical protein
MAVLAANPFNLALHTAKVSAPATSPVAPAPPLPQTPALDVAALGMKLRKPFVCGKGYQSKFSWAEALRLGRQNSVCGEIRSEADLARIPRNVSLRAVYVADPQGPAIRWANTVYMSSIFRNANHDVMYCSGDTVPPCRAGYIEVDSQGGLRAH